MGLVQQQRLAHFQVQFQPALPILLVDAHAMRPEAMPRGQQADDRRNVLFAGSNGLDVNHHVAVRQHGGHGRLDVVGDVVRPLERRAAADGQRHVGENLRPAAAQSQAGHVFHA